MELLPQLDKEADSFTASVNLWLPSTCDFNDAILVARANRAGIPRIISDDADLASFDGITLYTANRSVIEAARMAGKLVT